MVGNRGRLLETCHKMFPVISNFRYACRHNSALNGNSEPRQPECILECLELSSDSSLGIQPAAEEITGQAEDLQGLLLCDVLQWPVEATVGQTFDRLFPDPVQVQTIPTTFICRAGSCSKSWER